jgi:endonuclease/exonuclease/phosphatase family metal-dependent hydrolase
MISKPNRARAIPRALAVILAPATAPLHALVLAASIALAACASAPPASDTADLRAMSFNIRYGTANDGDDAWPHRRDLAIRVIDDFAPVVVGVQEALRFQLDEIGAALPHMGEVGVGRNDGVEAGEYSAILFDTRRMRLLDSGTFWLSDTPDVPGSMHWGNRITRIATWARFHDVALDTSFYVFNTHWDHESQPSRERSARLVLARIADRAAADPVILMGDFNAGADNAAFRALAARDAPVPLRDTFRAVHPDAGDVGTFHAFGGGRDGDRIDAILASPDWSILDAAIVRVHDAGRYPSDHYPVTAVLRLRR